MFAETDEPKIEHGNQHMSARRNETAVSRLLLRWMMPSCLGVLAWIAGSGCAIHNYAVNQFSNAVSRSGTVFASDDDPDLVKAASPSASS